MILAAVAALFASCVSDNKTNTGLLGGDSATITTDSAEVDSVAFESAIQDTFTVDSVN